jgi:SAM-dependent methyltransferase
MKTYHKYVFDTEERKYLGDFETMYQDGESKRFDSWHQEDMRQLNRQICYDILVRYNFDSVVDFGCGKGTFTHLLKKVNNHVLGLDVSKTAVEIAKARYPDLDFQVLDIASDESLVKFFDAMGRFGLSVCLDTLSYLPNYDYFIQQLASHSKYFLTAIYIPEDPIGYVKSEKNLADAFSSSFEVVEHVVLKNRRFVILFGTSKKL